ncbi:MAG TPA: hypothetical protein VM282_27555 [Acidimicrobiales bacterium]|nr:hypothetical protein [Acidimicrobiales bacterium]
MNDRLAPTPLVEPADDDAQNEKRGNKCRPGRDGKNNCACHDGDERCRLREGKLVSTYVSDCNQREDHEQCGVVQPVSRCLVPSVKHQAAHTCRDRCEPDGDPVEIELVTERTRHDPDSRSHERKAGKTVCRLCQESGP